MNESDEALFRSEVDRLVDDELSIGERSRLFAQLDASPGSWRQCALAFLEAREWRKSFKATLEPVRTPSDPVIAERSRALSGLGLFWAGLAGCVVLAFGLGLGLGMAGFVGSGSSRGSVTRDAGSGDGSTADVEPTLRDHELSRGTDVAWAPELVGLIQDPESENTVPIVSGLGFDENWLRSLPPPLTDYDRQRLERQGYHVEQGRKFVTVQLRQGERVTIPIDLVNVQYVGQRIY